MLVINMTFVSSTFAKLNIGVISHFIAHKLIISFLSSLLERSFLRLLPKLHVLSTQASNFKIISVELKICPLFSVNIALSTPSKASLYENLSE